MIKRLRWSKPAIGHKTHRDANNRFAKCDCIFVRDVIGSLLGKFSASRLRASID